jgi:hypothetical protein
MFRKNIYLFVLSFLFSFNGFAASFKGKIKDAKTNEPLVGATVFLKNTKIGTVAALDGSYEIKNLAIGSYEVVIQYIGYESKSTKIEINNSSQVVLIDFLLNEKVSQLAETVVSARANGENDEYARKTEQKSDNVMNIISAKTIQLLPDITVGNILQRVSGVSVVRNSTGDGQYAVIRGMDKRYNYTSINGVKIPSPDNKNRYVPMDIFPADLLERLEVVKALTPNMEGDAIGGAMNMVMKSVPDYLILSATATTGYSQLFGSQPFSGFRTKAIQFQSPSEIHGNSYPAKTTDFSIKNLQYKNVALPINRL